MRPQKTVSYFLHGLWTLVFVTCVFSSAAHASDLQIVQGEDAYVGQEIVLSLQGSLLSQKPLFEWSVSGDVKSVLLKNGGAEFAFTPINTSAIDIEAVAKNHDGQVLTTAKLGLTPRYFEVGIEKLEDEPLMLWDIKVKEERPTTELASNRPIRFEARLTPSYNGELRYDWTSDASTSILSSDASQTTITRSEIGDSELSVQIVNAAGIPLGRASRVVSVTVPSSRIEDSARQKAGWTDWQEAQAQWAQERHSDAVELAKRAAAQVPEDPDIAEGVKVMGANYDRILRALDLQKKGAEQREKDLLVEALKIYRRARVVWPMPESETSIKELEEAIDALRVKNQQAEWLKDTAAAYDQEGQIQEALDYYNQSQALVPSQAIEERILRISRRLELIAEADKLAGTGSSLERNGKLVEAIESYKASLENNPDEALALHVKELEEIVVQRKRQAAALFREGSDLQRKRQETEALLRYRESMAMWPSPEAQKRIDALERTVRLPKSADIRAPENFGIGTKSDAARFLIAGNKLYGEKRYREALVQYRKSYAISQDQILSELIRKLEASLNEYEAIQAANKLIKEGNLLYNQGRVQEAAAKYRESLAAHPNAEVEAFLKHIEGTASGSPDASPSGQGK